MVSLSLRMHCDVHVHVQAALTARAARSTALRNAAAQGGAGSTFEQLLAGILGEDCKGCDTDLGGCGTPCPILHTLQRQPQVFTISLAWESSQAGEEEVAATLKARLSDTFVCTRNERWMHVRPPLLTRLTTCLYATQRLCRR